MNHMNSTTSCIEFNRRNNEEGILSITRSLPFGPDTPFACGKNRFSINLLPVNESISAILYINEAQMSCISSENSAMVNRKEVFRLHPDKTIAVSKTYNDICIRMQVKALDNSHLFQVQLTIDAAISNAQALYESSNNDLITKYDNVLTALGTFFLGKVREVASRFSPTQNRELENALRGLNEQLVMNQPQGETFLDFLNVNFNTMKWMATVDEKVQAEINRAAQVVVKTDTNLDTLHYQSISLAKLKNDLPAYYFENEEYLALWMKVTSGEMELDDAKQQIDKRIKSRTEDVDDMAMKKAAMISGLVEKGLISASDARMLFGDMIMNQNSNADYSRQTKKVELLGTAVKVDDELSGLAFDDDDDFSEE